MPTAKLTSRRTKQSKALPGGPRSAKSRRFSPSAATEKLVPAVLIILLLALAAVLVLVGLSVLGLTG